MCVCAVVVLVVCWWKQQIPQFFVSLCVDADRTRAFVVLLTGLLVERSPIFGMEGVVFCVFCY